MKTETKQRFEVLITTQSFLKALKVAMLSTDHSLKISAQKNHIKIYFAQGTTRGVILLNAVCYDEVEFSENAHTLIDIFSKFADEKLLYIKRKDNSLIVNGKKVWEFDDESDVEPVKYIENCQQIKMSYKEFTEIWDKLKFPVSDSNRTREYTHGFFVFDNKNGGSEWVTSDGHLLCVLHSSTKIPSEIDRIGFELSFFKTLNRFARKYKPQIIALGINGGVTVAKFSKKSSSGDIEFLLEGRAIKDAWSGFLDYSGVLNDARKCSQWFVVAKKELPANEKSRMVKLETLKVSDNFQALHDKIYINNVKALKPLKKFKSKEIKIFTNFEISGEYCVFYTSEDSLEYIFGSVIHG